MKKHILNIVLCLLLVLSLGTVAAADSLDTTNLTVDGNTVTIGAEEDAVLTALHQSGKTAKLAIPFAYTDDDCYVVKDDTVVVTTTPEWNEAKDMIRFPVTGAGTYEIRTGTPETAASGTCGENLTWTLDAFGTLTISGSGEMIDFNEAENAPWYRNGLNAKAIVIADTVTSVGNRAFSGYPNLERITLSKNLTRIGNYAFSNVGYNLEAPAIVVTLPGALTTMGYDVFHGAVGLKKVVFEEGIANIGYAAFTGCEGLTELDFPESVSGIGDYAFENCINVSSITFAGDAPAFGSMVFRNITAQAHYPANASWPAVVRQSYGGTIAWLAYGTGAPGRVDVTDTELADETSVWVDGVSYPVQEDVAGNVYVDLPEAGGSTMVRYSYHEDVSGDVHTRYPVSMKVWRLEKQADGSYTAQHVEELDDILQYSGMSIRVTGKKGIRMITSIERDKKNHLVSDGLAGYTLKEYGNVVAWASQLSDTNPLVLGKSYAMSNYAYKKGVADPVFRYTDDLMQYTNVLVNFSDAQCGNEIAMRPYMILEDTSGEEITIYGGIVSRSIGYIAYQNRDVFDPGTEEYQYIWDIIHSVYGDVYDGDFEQY